MKKTKSRTKVKPVQYDLYTKSVQDVDTDVHPEDYIYGDNRYDLLDKIYLEGYQEYIIYAGKYSEVSCKEYFNLKITGCFKNVEKKVNALPLILRKEASELFFKQLKYQVKYYRAIGGFQSPEIIRMHKIGDINYTTYQLSRDKLLITKMVDVKNVDIKFYTKFLNHQNKAFETLLGTSALHREEIDFNIEMELFQKKLVDQNITPKPETTMVWNMKDEYKLRIFHEFLFNERFIDDIDFSIFKNHFSGLPQKEFINWKESLFFLNNLLDRLQNFINPNFYPRNNSSSPTCVARHFKRRDNQIIPNYFTSAKVKGPNALKQSKFKNTVDTLLAELTAS